MVDDEKRIAWLEQQVVGIVRLIAILVAMLVAAVVADVTVGHTKGEWWSWTWLAVAFPVFCLVSYLLQRNFLKGAPDHIKFIG